MLAKSMKILGKRLSSKKRLILGCEIEEKLVEIHLCKLYTNINISIAWKSIARAIRTGWVCIDIISGVFLKTSSFLPMLLCRAYPLVRIIHADWKKKKTGAPKS